MIAWMVRAVAIAAMLAGAAALVDGALRRLGRERRWAWTSALAAAALLPFAGVLLARLAPKAALGPLALERLLAALAASSPADGASGAGSGMRGWLLGCWVAASAGLLLAQAYAMARLRASRRRWPSARVGGVEVLLSGELGPAVVGVLRPAVVLPAWAVAGPERERDLVLAHERAHIASGDPWLLAAGAAITALVPWNPALWWLRRRLHAAVELDCDRRVLALGCDPGEYGRTLLAAAGRRSRPLSALALTDPDTLLERRIRAMTEQMQAGGVRRAAALVAGAAVLAVAACELASPARNDRDPAGATSVNPAASQASAPAPAAAEPGTYRVKTAEGEKTFMFRRRQGDREAESGFKKPGAAPVYDLGKEPEGPRKIRTTGPDKSVIFVDGKRVPNDVLKTLDPARIASIDVLKGRPAAEYLGKDDGSAVILIKMK